MSWWDAVKNWFARFFWPRACLSDIQASVESIHALARMTNADVDMILRELAKMSEREDAAFARQAELIQSVKDGWGSLVAERDALKEALENADADAAAQVQAALDADSEVDAAKVEAANAALDELVNPAPPVEPPADEPVDEEPSEDEQV